MYPVLSIVGPGLTFTVPQDYTAYQGMDAFFHASESVINTKNSQMGEMYALLAITLVAKYLPRAVKNGKDRQARSFVSLANTLAGYYMRCTSAHSLEHAMGGFHPKLPHGAGLIMLAHAYYAFFADRKACEGQMVKMAKAMGMPDARTGRTSSGPSTASWRSAASRISGCPTTASRRMNSADIPPSPAK